MIKTSKKEIRETGERRNGYYFTGNVYSYENCIYYLRSLAYETESDKIGYVEQIEETIKRLHENVRKETQERTSELVKMICTIEHDDMNMEQVLYSAGIYGNNGQLHELTLYNKGNIVAMFTLYY